jgi:hypothetical protein
MTHSANNFRAALRLGTVFAVLALSPAIALADDLMDYGGDGAVVPSEPVQTDYRVGRGYVTDEEMSITAAPDWAATVAPGEPEDGRR